MGESKRIECVVFVWNAEMNLKGACVAVTDFVKQQHSCSLCEIAYHTVTPKHDWKSYKAGLGIPIQELYKNQLTDEQRHCIAGEYPAVLGKLGEQYVRLLGKQEIDACEGDLIAFKEKLDARLALYAT